MADPDTRESIRRYCWRVGAALVYPGDVCPECGNSDHRRVAEGMCGNFVLEGHGRSCALAPEHDGPCRGWTYGV
jgi:hypothetical protein